MADDAGIAVIMARDTESLSCIHLAAACSVEREMNEYLHQDLHAFSPLDDFLGHFWF
jgi:hypothetical protein